MQISIRDRSATTIAAYKPYERSYSLGNASLTESGFWIVFLPNQPLNVARDKNEARAMLQTYFAKKDD